MSNQPAPAEVRLVEIRRGQRLQVLNRSRGLRLASDLELALDPWRRLRGLLGRPALTEEAAMLLRPCRSVHTFFMGQPIDVAFLDDDGRVVAAAAGLLPWRVTAFHPQACATLELAAGRLARTGTRVEDRLIFVQMEPERQSS
jgi:uncharacterized membrane protein (UPF0127 family)